MNQNQQQSEQKLQDCIDQFRKKARQALNDPKFFGTIGAELYIQNGCSQTIKTKVEQTSK